MKNLYIFANDVYFGCFQTEAPAEELCTSIEINNGMDEGMVKAYISPNGMTLDSMNAEVEEGEMFLIKPTGCEIVNAPIDPSTYDDYNDPDTGFENMKPEYIQVVRKVFELLPAE